MAKVSLIHNSSSLTSPSSLSSPTSSSYPSSPISASYPSSLTTMGITASIIHSFSNSKTSIDDFIYQREIGRGGFSTVMCVMNKKNKGCYALKKTSIVGAITRCGNVNFLSTEIRCLKALGSHPFIVGLQYALHDFVDCYLVLDLVPGGDLRYQLDRKFLMNESELALIALCLGSALKHIHNHNVLHRDIKPENIVIDRYGIPHLTDFGISYCGTTPELGELLVCNLPSGTKPYMAPEMLTRSRLHGTAADYWALGITLFELLSGIRPFKTLPTNYIQYARRAHYYECAAACSEPIGDMDYNDEGYLESIMNESSSIMKSSPAFQQFLTQLLDVRITYRLGGQNSKHPFLSHPWLAEHSAHWFEKISALQSIKTRTQSFSTRSVSSFEDREMVMTSDWYSERYLSCRKVGPPLTPSSNSDGVFAQVEDIRKTSHYNQEIETMLSLYDYEAPTVVNDSLPEEILQLGHPTTTKSRHQTIVSSEDSIGHTLTQMRRDMRSHFHEDIQEVLKQDVAE